MKLKSTNVERGKVQEGCLNSSVEKDFALPITISMRAYFSSYHLWAAQAFSAAAERIESNHSGTPRFDIAHRAYVNNSILAAVAFAEAAINEVYQDAADGHTGYIKSLSKEAVSTLADYWNMTEMKNKSYISMPDKYQLALRFCGVDHFNTNHSPYQDAYLAVNLRNTLVPGHVKTSGKQNSRRLNEILLNYRPHMNATGSVEIFLFYSTDYTQSTLLAITIWVKTINDGHQAAIASIMAVVPSIFITLFRL